MTPKHIMIVGTMVITISIGTAVWGDKTSANPLHKAGCVFAEENFSTLHKATPGKCADILQVLGLSSDDEIYEALYNGKSLAELAAEREIDVQQVIDLQVSEMTEQLNARVTEGTLTIGQYEAQKAELPEIITRSVYGYDLNGR